MSDAYICLPQPQFARLLELFALLLDATEVNCEIAAAGVAMSKETATNVSAAVADVRQQLVEIGGSALVGIKVDDDPRGQRLAIH
jgi:hypothetical protein